MSHRTATGIVLSVLVLALVACGGGDGDSSRSNAATQASAPNGIPTAPRWSRCVRGGWDQSVAGLSCRAASRIIKQDLLRFPPQRDVHKNTAAAIYRSAPSSFSGAGFECTAFPLVDGSGWHNVCQKGSQHLSFYFTP